MRRSAHEYFEATGDTREDTMTRDDAIALYASDPRATLTSVGLACGVHFSTVAAWLRRAGVERRPVGRPRREVKR